jgi:GAF domain-containing protein
MASPLRADVLSAEPRLAALERSGLLDPETDEAFDRLVGLAARTVRAPVAFLSVVTSDALFYKAAAGLPESVESRFYPADESVCRLVVERRTWLLVQDAFSSPLIGDLPLVRGGQVGAYLGVPVASSDAQILGALCVVEPTPRRWGMPDLEALLELAAVAASYVELAEARRALTAALARGPEGVLARRESSWVHAPWAVDEARRAAAAR